MQEMWSPRRRGRRHYCEWAHVYLDDSLARETSDQGSSPDTCLWPLKKHEKGQYIFLTPGHRLNLPPAPKLTTANNPYRGLESFGEEHKALFFRARPSDSITFDAGYQTGADRRRRGIRNGKVQRGKGGTGASSAR